MQHRFTPSGHIPCWDAVQRFQLENFGLDSTRCQRSRDGMLKSWSGKGPDKTCYSTSGIFKWLFNGPKRNKHVSTDIKGVGG